MTPGTTAGWLDAAQNHDLKIWLDHATPLYFQLIPAGSFRMGARGEYRDEEPIHRVQITEPFYMSTFPVTQAQWRVAVAQFNSSDLNPNPSAFNGDMRPVEEVNWHDANEWCRLLSTIDAVRDPTDSKGKTIKLQRMQFDLPTEAQWEYACRAGTETEYYTGDGAVALQAAGWFDENFETRRTMSA